MSFSEPPDTASQKTRVDSLLKELSLTEKIAMMSGSGFYAIHARSKRWGAEPYPAGGRCDRLGIEGLTFSDGPRGVVVGRSTCFPCVMARGATFDRELERRIGEAMAIEARAQGCNLLGAVCVNVLRHPAWGRAQETYGEDSYHLGVMGAALATGIQHHNVIATVKHFALNSIENSRFKVDVRVDNRTLWEIYLPQFKKVIDAGCLSVMSAYNKVNGIYCSENSHLLTDILRKEWGFQGFVHSDWVLGVHSPFAAVAGLDIENPEPAWFGDQLYTAVTSGSIKEGIIDQAVKRILSVFCAITTAQDPVPTYKPESVACYDHRQLALAAAERSAVLLRNENVLPLSAKEINTVAVFGKLANQENTGDHGSSRVNSPYVISPLQGLQEFLGANRVVFSDGDNRDTISDLASAADAAIVVVGYTAVDEGEYIPDDINLGQTELPPGITAILQDNKDRRQGMSVGGDRQSLRLHARDETLIKTVAAANPKTIVIVVAGSAVIMEAWLFDAGAVLQTFYAGMEGGRALARLLFGEVSPSGKLPFTVARDPSHYPAFDCNADRVSYDYWHGYALLDRGGNRARFPFGFGLSYATFVYKDFVAAVLQDGSLQASVTVTNTGPCRAAEVVQLYIAWPGIDAERPEKNLKGFERIELDVGEAEIVTFRIPANELCWFDPDSRGWRYESGRYVVMVGGSSEDCYNHRVALLVDDAIPRDTVK